MRPPSKARGRRNLTGFNRRATRLGGMQLPSNPEVILARALNVPGMTEFSLGADGSLGLMPESGIKSLLGDALPDPAGANGTPRAELYLSVRDPAAHHARALQCGARELSPLEPRDWGDVVAYSLDPDGHVLAFATILA